MTATNIVVSTRTIDSDPRPRVVVEGTKFFGRPNFAGELDRFKDDRRKFSILLPAHVVPDLQALGYNAKIYDNPEQPDVEPVGHIRIMLNFSIDHKNPGREKGPEIYIKQGEHVQQLNSQTARILDTAQILDLGLEFRGWEYDPDEAPGMLSARLVKLVALIEPSALSDRYAI